MDAIEPVTQTAQRTTRGGRGGWVGATAEIQSGSVDKLSVRCVDKAIEKRSSSGRSVASEKTPDLIKCRDLGIRAMKRCCRKKNTVDFLCDSSV